MAHEKFKIYAAPSLEYRGHYANKHISLLNDNAEGQFLPDPFTLDEYNKKMQKISQQMWCGPFFHNEHIFIYPFYL